MAIERSGVMAILVVEGALRTPARNDADGTKAAAGARAQIEAAATENDFMVIACVAASWSAAVPGGSALVFQLVGYTNLQQKIDAHAVAAAV